MGAVCLEENIFLTWDPEGRELLMVRRQAPLFEQGGGGQLGEKALLALPLIYGNRCQVSGSWLCGNHCQVLLPRLSSTS